MQSFSRKASPNKAFRQTMMHVNTSNLIGDETDFIFKVRNKWIHHRNHHFATKIQTWVRMLQSRRLYRLQR